MKKNIAVRIVKPENRDKPVFRYYRPPLNISSIITLELFGRAGIFR